MRGVHACVGLPVQKNSGKSNNERNKSATDYASCTEHNRLCPACQSLFWQSAEQYHTSWQRAHLRRLLPSSSSTSATWHVAHRLAAKLGLTMRLFCSRPSAAARIISRHPGCGKPRPICPRSSRRSSAPFTTATRGGGARSNVAASWAAVRWFERHQADPAGQFRCREG